jgi:hypothetical protein
MHVRQVLCGLVLALGLQRPAARPAAVAVPPSRLLVLSIDLNDLTGREDPADPPRLAVLTHALRQRFVACGYSVVALDSAAERRAHLGDGYLYAHPDAAAALAARAGAEWALVPRLNRASPWVTDLQAHVVRVGSGRVVSNRVVELKGFGMAPALTARLAERGAAWMADQVDQAIGWAAAPGAPVVRHCPP